MLRCFGHAAGTIGCLVGPKLACARCYETGALLNSRNMSPDRSAPMEVLDIDIDDEVIRKQWQDLQLEWLHQYDLWEPADQYQLDNPDSIVLKKGGRIIGIFIDGNIAATAAMFPVDSSKLTWEIIKVAVLPIHQRKGLGDVVFKYAIDHCRDAMQREVDKLSGGRIVDTIIQMDSSTKLEAALNMYTKHGFMVIEGAPTRYETADIFLQLNLNLSASAQL